MRNQATALPGRVARIGFCTLLLALCAAFALAPAADAKRIKGSGGGDRITGTQKKDRVNARGGNDKIRSRKGRDRVRGGKGADKLNGGNGKDVLAGGEANDRIRAADRKRDRKVNGGAGEDSCVVDQVDLGVVSACETLQARGAAPEGSLELTSATGLSCTSQLPTCTFQLNGVGAEDVAGTVIAGGGAVLGGASVSISADDWSAAGTYGCSDHGFLRVEIGPESVEVPITCETEAEAPSLLNR
jgi:hypothetical protein